MIVVDASVAVKWFVAEVGDDQAHSLLDGTELLIGPDFVILETLNVLRRKHKRAEIGAVQLGQAAVELVGFFDRLVPAKTLIQQTMTLSLSLDHDVYECAYLACALRHQAKLITADQVFVEKALASGFGAAVILLDRTPSPRSYHP